MARKIKWRLQFKSLNDTGCLVNIYEEGYSSQADTTKTGADVPFAVETGVTELIGGAVPFEYQEDDSNNLLEVIRIKTAYLRVVEINKHDLDDLFPTSIRHHFVEAFYGIERVFTGYMQCQEFDNPWVANPRELEFACVSPLGLLEAFNFAVPNDHGLVTFGTLMQEVMIGLNPSATDATVSDYQHVIYPTKNTQTAGDNNEYTPWNNKFNSTVIIPFNSDFRYYDYTPQGAAKDLWKPQSYHFFVEGLCRCFGWIAHDTPDGIVFTKYDNTETVYKISISGLTTLSGAVWLQQLTTGFENYYENVDDNADLTTVTPVKQITLKLEGASIEKKELTTKHTIARDNMLGSIGFRSIALQQVGPDVTASNLGKASISMPGGELTNKGTFPLAYGKIQQGDLSVSLDNAWIIGYDYGWPDGTNLITAKFFGNPPRSSDGFCLLKFRMERGDSLRNMQASGYDDISLNLVVKVDNLYYDIWNNVQPSASVIYNNIIIDGGTGKVVHNRELDAPQIGFPDDIGDVDGIIFNIGYKVAGVVEIGLYKSGSTNLLDGEILRITELSLNDPGHFDEDFYNYYDSRDEVIVSNTSTGTELCDINVPFNNYSSYRGENSFCGPDDFVDGEPPSYPYMFRPLHVLTERVKRTTTIINFNEYEAKWTYWIFGWRWRMIAKNFNMRDDEFTVTLARSSTIE